MNATSIAKKAGFILAVVIVAKLAVGKFAPDFAKYL